MDVDLDAGRVLLFGAIGPTLGLEGESDVTDRAWCQGAVHPDDVETVGAGIDEVFARRAGSSPGCSTDSAAPMGPTFPCSTVPSLCALARRPACVVCSLMDMTERLRYEAALEQAPDAQEASRAKSEFLGAPHERDLRARGERGRHRRPA